jgi:hypothetical protein
MEKHDESDEDLHVGAQPQRVMHVTEHTRLQGSRGDSEIGGTKCDINTRLPLSAAAALSSQRPQRALSLQPCRPASRRRFPATEPARTQAPRASVRNSPRNPNGTHPKKVCSCTRILPAPRVCRCCFYFKGAWLVTTRHTGFQMPS